MRSLLQIVCFVTLVSCLCFAQVEIENPNQLPVPADRVQLIYNIACRVVAEEINPQNPAPVHFHIKLLLGAVPSEYVEYVDADKSGQESAIVHMAAWDEAKFSHSVMNVAMQRMFSKKRRRLMLGEIVRRVRQLAPIPADELRRQQTGSIGK